MRWKSDKQLYLGSSFKVNEQFIIICSKIIVPPPTRFFVGILTRLSGVGLNFFDKFLS